MDNCKEEWPKNDGPTDLNITLGWFVNTDHVYQNSYLQKDLGNALKCELTHCSEFSKSYDFKMSKLENDLEHLVSSFLNIDVLESSAWNDIDNEEQRCQKNSIEEV